MTACKSIKNRRLNRSLNFNLDQKVGPRADHTTRSPSGHYLLYDGSTANAPNPLSFTSGPVTRPFNSTTAACFSLWYYVDSESKFNLTFGFYPINAITTYIPFYKTTGAVVSRSWKQAQGTIENVPGSLISLKLQHSTPFVGGLAIDDIRLTIGRCRYDTGMECDFSTDYCGYQVWTVTFA